MSPEGSTVTFRRVPEILRRSLERPLQRFASTLEREVAAGRTFACLVTTDAELRRLNRAFRGKDAVTDVLSFRAGPLPNSKARYRGRGSERNGVLGDLAISVPRARAQARQFGHTLEHEIRILMLHGLLHLLGMDHQTDRGRMARAERRWRARLGLPLGLIERIAS
jgi:probable rRNA maturation factor